MPSRWVVALEKFHLTPLIPPSIVDRAPRGIADVRELVGRIVAIGDGLDDAVPVGGGADQVAPGVVAVVGGTGGKVEKWDQIRLY